MQKNTNWHCKLTEKSREGLYVDPGPEESKEEQGFEFVSVYLKGGGSLSQGGFHTLVSRGVRPNE